MPPKLRLPAALVAMWAALFFIGSTISTLVWVEFLTFLVGYVVSDLVYDWVMKKRDPRTLTDMFLNYFVAVLGGSLIAEYASENSVSTMQFFYSLFPMLPYQTRVDVVIALGTTLEILLGFGAAWRLHSDERKRIKRLPPR
jgi:hypothetical protein